MVNTIPKTSFLFRNILRGFIWLAFIIAVFIIFKKYVDLNYLEWLEPIYSNSFLVYLIFVASEIIFGIIPPELFMIWGLRNGILSEYISIIALLAFFSYTAGVIGYFIGRYLNTTLFYRLLRKRFLRKSERLLNVYGLYLIIIASFTPLPFSGISMLVGSVRYPFKKYLFYSLARIVRFAVFALFIWEVNAI